MTFPASPLDLRCELDLSSWTDVSAYAYQRDGMQPPVKITRGRPDESSQANPATCAWQWNNRDGRFSPKNPLSPYYGLLGRNTPVRWSVPAVSNYLRLENNSHDRAYVNDNAAIDITGSVEMRISLRLTDWRGCVLACKWDGGGCWEWLLGPDGTMLFAWYDSGVTYHQVVSTVPLSYTSGDFALRVTLDVTTGTVAFYSAAGSSVDPAAWTQLGTASSGTGGAATSVQVQHNSALAVGYSFNGGVNGGQAQLFGRVYEYRLYNGIGGTVAADGVFASVTPGAASWTDTQGNLWQLAGGAEISGRNYRLHGEMSSQPPKWDVSGTDHWVAAAAGGPLRRLGQGTANAMSAMKRAILSQSGALAPVAYWPLEDAAGASLFGSAVPGGLPMTFTQSPAPNLASDSSFTASAPLPALNGARFQGKVAPYTATGTWTVRFLLKVASSTDSGTLVRVAAGAVVYANVQAGGSMELVVYAPDGTVHTAGYDVLPGVTTGVWCSLEAQPASGGGVQYSLVVLQPGASTGSEVSLTVTSQADAGTVRLVQFAPQNGKAGTFGSTVVGHCSVQSAWASLFTLGQPLNAWQGELAATRYARLAGENGYQVRILGSPAASAPMGPQGQATLKALLDECEAADLGQQFEPRQQLALGYRTLASMCGQVPAVTLDYAQSQPGGVSGGGNDSGLDPVYDDQLIGNDWTVARGAASGSQGATWQSQLNDGSPMSISDPPTGAGDYAKTATANVQSDTQLPDVAGWKTHTGTVDEARWPAIPVNLARTEIQSAGLYYPLLDTEVGDHVKLTDVPDVILYDPVRQLAYGMKENLGGFHHTMEFNAVPESPYETAIFDDPVYGRADTSGSQLAAPLAAPVIAAVPDLQASGWTAAHGTLGVSAAPVPSDVTRWALLTFDGTAFGGVRSPQGNVAANQKYCASGLLYTAAAHTLRVGITWYAGSAYLSDSVSVTSFPAGVITPWAAGPFTAPATATRAAVLVQDAAPVAGEQVYATVLTAWPATSLSVSVSGDRWTQNAADFPFDVKAAGERMTVTAIGPGTSRTGMYLADGDYHTDWSAGASLWQSWSGQPVTVARYYAGTNYTYTTDLQELVAAGVKIRISFTPAYNPVSSSDLASITGLLSTLKAAGADVKATIWHEPYFNGLTSAQYQAAVAYYAPSMRTYCPFVPCLTGPDLSGAHGSYLPTTAVDGIAVDVYPDLTYAQGIMDPASAWADAQGLPLAVWEFGVSPGPNYFTGDSYGFSGGTTGAWVAAQNCTIAPAASVARPFGTTPGALAVTSTGGTAVASSASAASYATQMQACSPDDEILLGAWVQAAATPRAAEIHASFYTSTGVFVSSVTAASGTDGTSWTALTGTVTAPATAAYYRLSVQWSSTVAGEVHYATLMWASDSSATGFTKAQGQQFFAWLQAYMLARIAGGWPNGDMMMFSAGLPGNRSATAILYPQDYRVAAWQTMRAALDGTSGPQPFTLARAVNGVVKAQTAGADVRLWFPPIFALT